MPANPLAPTQRPLNWAHGVRYFAEPDARMVIIGCEECFQTYE